MTGVTCTPSSGSGELDTVISGVSPGDQIFLFVGADLVDPDSDQTLFFGAQVQVSEFNVETNTGNNAVLLEI